MGDDARGIARPPFQGCGHEGGKPQRGTRKWKERKSLDVIPQEAFQFVLLWSAKTVITSCAGGYDYSPHLSKRLEIPQAFFFLFRHHLMVLPWQTLSKNTLQGVSAGPPLVGIDGCGMTEMPLIDK